MFLALTWQTVIASHWGEGPGQPGDGSDDGCCRWPLDDRHPRPVRGDHLVAPGNRAGKREAVRLMESSGRALAQLARDLGINDNNLYRWRPLYGSAAHVHPTGTLTQMEAELKGLRRENEVLRAERDILKKAMSIVSRSQR